MKGLGYYEPKPGMKREIHSVITKKEGRGDNITQTEISIKAKKKGAF
jgi:hypothetical protein